jgi:hypothetical protein
MVIAYASDMETPIARLARRIVDGKRRDCAECGSDMGVTKEITCSEACANERLLSSAY